MNLHKLNFSVMHAVLGGITPRTNRVVFFGLFFQQVLIAVVMAGYGCVARPVVAVRAL